MTIEYSRKRSYSQLESILKDCPRVHLDNINDLRESRGQERIDVEGRPNTEGSLEQLQSNRDLLLRRRVDRLMAEAAALRDTQ